MKTVNEIKEVYEWSRAINGFSQNDMNELIFGILIGITEHLEAQPVESIPTCQVAGATTVDPLIWTVTTTNDTIRRGAMIEALRWAHKNAICNHQLCGAGSPLLSAIARLENGGEL